MDAFHRCPMCGGDLVRKQVEKLLRGANQTVAVHIMADVCTHCGERLYSSDTIRRFEQIREKLTRGDVDEFERIGQSYQAV